MPDILLWVNEKEVRMSLYQITCSILGDFVSFVDPWIQGFFLIHESLEDRRPSPVSKDVFFDPISHKYKRMDNEIEWKDRIWLCHEILSLYVPNIQFNLNVSVDILTLGFWH